MRRRLHAAPGVAIVVLLLLGGMHLASASSGHSARGDQGQARDRRPNIVMVLMDDASLELLRTMPYARQMQRQGATYTNSHVVDSLCCPSRTSIFTGRPPHQTGVLTNTAQDPQDPIGGYAAFARHHNEERSFNVPLHRSGYTTAFIGKYINGYGLSKNAPGERLAPAEEPGWSEFGAVLGSGYPEWGFWSTRLDRRTGLNTLVHDAKPPADAPVSELDRHYATNVMSDRALDFLRRQRNAAEPYFLEVATYGPHAQMHRAYPGNPTFPSAFADRAPDGDPTGGTCGTRSCVDVRLRDLVGYGDPRRDNRPVYLHRDGTTSPAPAWNDNPVRLKAARALEQYRDRVRMVQSIDWMLGRIRHAVGPNTYVVLTSDNGYHLGQLRLNGGKGSPYDFDTRVPLVVAGPGVPQGRRSQFVSNIDLAPTFERMAGLKVPGSVSGVSFLDSLKDPKAPGQRRFAFFDHTWAPAERGEVDGDQASHSVIAQIPSYIGVRGARGLLVRFDLDDNPRRVRYAWELYDYRAGFEKTNVFTRDHGQPWARELMRRLRTWDDCAPAQCRAAGR